MTVAMLPSVSPRVRFALWVVLVLGVLLGQCVWMVLLRGPRILDADGLLIGGHLVVSALLVALMALLATTPTNAIKLHRGTSNFIILGGAVLLQLGALTLLWPALSDDVVRYRLEGRMWVAGQSPYACSPGQFFSEQPDSADAIDRLVFEPSMATIYPPVAQAIFVIGRAIEDVLLGPFEPAVAAAHWRTALPDLPASRHAIVQRAIKAIFAVVAVALILWLLAGQDRSAWWAVLFAWHPLTVLEAGGMGHVDIVGVTLVLAALLAHATQRSMTAAVMLALAIAVKPQVVLLAPVLMAVTWGRCGRWWLVGIVALVVMAAIYGFALLFQGGYAGWGETVARYAVHWEANGSIYELIKHTLGRGDDHQLVWAKHLARRLALAATLSVFVCVFAISIWRAKRSRNEAGAEAVGESILSLAMAGYWVHFLPLLFAPVVYPWYLLWMLCFVPLLPAPQAWPGLVWAATVVISYVLWHQPTWSVPPSLALAQYVPVFIALLTYLIRQKLFHRLLCYAPA